VQFNFTPAPPDSTQVGAFGGLTIGVSRPGTFTFGSITFRAPTIVGSFAIKAFLRADIDEWVGPSGLNLVVPSLPGTTLNVIPEPASAALLGLGLVGLIAVRSRIGCAGA
jgi:hypothetical protein